MKISFPSQLALRFEQAIVDGKYLKGRKVDCLELAIDFSASAEEMDRVLLAEHRKGLVRKLDCGYEIAGLIEPSFDSLFQHTARSGLTPSSAVRAVIVEPATPLVAQKLALRQGAPVYRMDRTRNVNDEPVANQVNYLPYEICPGLEDEDISHHSFQKLLEHKYHTVMADLREEIQMEPATAEDCRVLSLPAGACVLVVDRLTFSATQFPLVWARVSIRPDRYNYVATLWPQAAQALANPR